MVAKITESRKRTLFPPQTSRRTDTPPADDEPADNPSHHASESGSASASVSKTHGKEPHFFPIHLGSYGPSQAVAPSPEGRQIVAHSVSRGSGVRKYYQPQRGDRHGRLQRFGTSREAAKPRSREGDKALFHAGTRRPPRGQADISRRRVHASPTPITSSPCSGLHGPTTSASYILRALRGFA